MSYFMAMQQSELTLRLLESLRWYALGPEARTCEPPHCLLAGSSYQSQSVCARVYCRCYVCSVGPADLACYLKIKSRYSHIYGAGTKATKTQRMVKRRYKIVKNRCPHKPHHISSLCRAYNVYRAWQASTEFQASRARVLCTCIQRYLEQSPVYCSRQREGSSLPQHKACKNNNTKISSTPNWEIYSIK